MSSVSIREIASYYMGNAGNVGGAAKAAPVSGNREEFSQIFEKANNQAESQSSSSETVAGKAEAKSIQDHANVQKKEVSQLQEKQDAVQQLDEEERILNAAEEIGAQMLEEVAKTFNVSVEEVEQVMETLGLVPLDLLNAEKLTQLVLGLNPQADYLTIITDENLFADLKGLMNTAKDLMNQTAQQFQLSEEELEGLFAKLQDEAVQTMEAEEGLILTGEEVMPTKADGEGEVEAVTIKTTDMGTKEQVSRPEVTVEAVKEQASESQPEMGGKGSNDQPSGENFAANLLQQLSEAVEQASGREGASYGVSGQEIVQQITEQIRVLVKADTTQLELQLNPENLGSLKVEIASKSGILTATFTTENEAVKAALEGQLVQLKESFEQQGLKVEAVEVNVDARGFERSLDQQSQEQKEFQQEAKKSQRRISLRGLEEAGEELLEGLSEGDKLAADMMARNGNTLDYTV